jgi:hypothetical protein
VLCVLNLSVLCVKKAFHRKDRKGKPRKERKEKAVDLFLPLIHIENEKRNYSGRHSGKQFLSRLQEKLSGDVKALCQSFGLRSADAPLTVDDLRCRAATGT